MDRKTRALEREWMADGDPESLNNLLTSLLRMQSLDAWEQAAEQNDEEAVRYVDLLRNFGKEEALEASDVFINVYEDFTARSTMLCNASQITEVRRWMRDFYTTNQIFYAGREVYDLSLSREVQDPAARLVIENSVEPCFRMHPGEITEEASRRGIDLGREDYDYDGPPQASLLRSLAPINRHGTRDHYVSFYMIDEYPDVEQEPEQERTHIGEGEISNLPHWINAYEVTRHYGGAAGGAWYFNMYSPIASIYVGTLPTEVYGREENLIRDRVLRAGVWIDAAQTFLSSFYEDITRGDIYSVNGGAELNVQIQSHPAVQDPFYRPTNY